VFIVNIVVNGEPKVVSQSATITTLLNQLNLAGKHVAVEVNLELVPHHCHQDRCLADGDRLEIVTLVGGG